MKYRTRTGKPTGDQELIGDLSKSFGSSLKRTDPFILGFIVTFFSQLISIGAYPIRCILRAKLGERTFGIFSIFLSLFAIWLMILYGDLYTITLEEELYVKFGQPNSLIDYVLMSFVNIFYALIVMFVLPITLLSTDSSSELFEILPNIPLSIYAFMILFLICSIAHLTDIYRRNKREEWIHTLYRGDSLLFSWLEGKKIANIKVTTIGIWLIIEPIFVIVIALILINLDTYKSLASVLIISSLCLMLEEYSVYVENRRMQLDAIDNRLDSQYMVSIQKKLEQEMLHNMIIEENKTYSANY